MSLYKLPPTDALALLDPLSESPSLQPVKATPSVVGGSLNSACLDREAAIYAAKTNLNFFAASAMPDVYKVDYPPYYHALWKLLCDRAELQVDITQLGLGLPRGFVKTGFMKLLCLYLILFTDRKFLLLVSATASLAENSVADIMAMLGSPNIVDLFGDWRLGVEKDTKELKKFGFRGRNIVIACLGAGGSPRGLNIYNERPDFILMDDIQTREVAVSEVLSQSLLLWMTATLLKTKDRNRCLTVFLGNMYPHPGCILKKLVASSSWLTLVVGAILADGKSLWPEFVSLESLMAELKSDMELGVTEVFLAEVLNDPDAGSRAGIDISKIPTNPYDLSTEQPQGKLVVIDPALGKTSSDPQAIGLFYIYDGKPVLVELDVGHWSPLECIKRALNMCVAHNCRLVGVESVAYQSTLLFWFQYICESINLTGFHFVEIFTHGVSKNSRILTMFRSLLAGELYIGQEVYSQAIAQILAFEPKTTNNVDDILDVLAYALPMYQTYGHLALPDTLEELFFPRGEVLLEVDSVEF